jgi:hypothetical protein
VVGRRRPDRETEVYTDQRLAADRAAVEPADADPGEVNPSSPVASSSSERTEAEPLDRGRDPVD